MVTFLGGGGKPKSDFGGGSGFGLLSKFKVTSFMDGPLMVTHLAKSIG